MGTGSCPLHGPPPYVWTASSNSYHPSLSTQMMWSNSPSRVNNIPTPPQFSGLSRVAAQSHMMSPILPLHHHSHMGSAPVVNPSPWAAVNRPGSLGSVGFDLPSQAAAFPAHMLYGRSSVAAVESPIERGRTRRGETAVAQVPPENKKQYELDLEKISCGDDVRTTLMIKNIPNK